MANPELISLLQALGRLPSGRVRKKHPFGRIIKRVTFEGRELTLHATKGWRSNRIST